MEDNLQDVELHTYSKTASVVTLIQNHSDSSLCFDNQDYLSMDRNVDHVSINSSSVASGYEEMNYENMILPPPVAYDDVQTQTLDSVIYENCSPRENNDQTADKSVNIITRLRIHKTASFWRYSYFAVNVIFREVESLIYLDVCYILMSLLLVGFGVKHLHECPISTSLIYIVFFYAGCAVVSSGMNFSMKFRNRKSIYHVFETIACRFIRMLMVVCCLLGLVEVYGHFPPNENDTKSSKYCSPLLYWSAAYNFTLTASVVVVIIVIVLIALMWYFM